MAPEHNVTGGLMAAVGLSADAADARLKKEGLENTVVGCDNSPVNVTLAGALSVLQAPHLLPQACAETAKDPLTAF
jgi:hypothetical protein